MFKRIIFACLMMLSFHSFAACEIPSAGISADTYKQLKEVCEKSIAKVSVDEIKSNFELASSLGSVSKEFASSLGVAAKELGIAANEFLNTPAGLITAFVIIWKVFMIQFLGLVLVFGIIITNYLIFRQILTESSEPIVVTYFWGAYQRVKSKKTYSNFGSLNGDQGGTMVISIILSIVFSWIIIANMIV